MSDETAKRETRMVLHRKWRSRDFEDLVGQEHVVRTLRNALSSGRTASAYLFCGPRGTGKTSTARILAKAINCPDTRDGEPCGKCRICKSISSGTFLDVIEMDAASHTQVDKIREFIVEKVNFRPVEAQKKIYIIDEVHKLSSNSFDALLKTIEEPPSFVIFILATTDPEKLPPTIVSRCQRFDFRRISVTQIVDRLKMISAAEGFCIEDGALNIIARAADGALRDALVILEQSVSFSRECITADDVISLLGITREESLFSFAEMVLLRDVRKGLLFINELYREGRDLKRFAADAIEHFRRLLLIRMVNEAEHILEVTPDTYHQLQGQAQQFKVTHLMHIIKDLMDLRRDLKEMGIDLLLWEMAAIKIIRWEVAPGLDSLSRRVAELEAAVNGGTRLKTDTISSGTFVPPPNPISPPVEKQPLTPSVPKTSPPQPIREKSMSFAPPSGETEAAEIIVVKEVQDVQEVKEVKEVEEVRTEEISPSLPPIPRDDDDDGRVSVHDELGHAYPDKSPIEKAPQVSDSGFWHRFLREVARDKQALVPVLKDIGAGTLQHGEYILKVSPDQGFSRNIIENNRRYLEDVLSKTAGTKTKLKIKSSTAEKLFDNNGKNHQVFVQEVSDMFGARPVDR